MTEKYWQRYKQEWLSDPMNTNELWVRVKQDLKRREKPKHTLQLYTYCRSDNPYIRQIKNSPNITGDTVAELICRQQACELQYCLSLQPVATANRRANIDLQGCSDQYNTMTTCLQTEKRRIKEKEDELRNLVYGIKVEVPEQKIKQIENPIQEKEMKQYM